MVVIDSFCPSCRLGLGGRLRREWNMGVDVGGWGMCIVEVGLLALN